MNDDTQSQSRKVGNIMADNERRIEHVAVLDWSKVRSADELKDIQRIEHVGVVLIAEHLAGALTHVRMEHVGSIVPVPEGAEVKIFAGQTRIAGEALETAPPDSIWIIAGQLFITTPVRETNCKELRVSGQIFIPRGSEAAISSKLSRLEGQVIYYPAGARFFYGTENFTAEFLELLPEPIPIMILGNGDFADDITVDLLRAKVTEIGLAGNIVAPRHLVPLLNVLTVEKMGNITARE
jgi:hypothetical protein